MKITTKFIGSSTLLVIFVAILSGSSYWLNRRAANSLEASYIQSQQAAAAVARLESTLQDQLVSLSRLSVLSNKNAEMDYYRRQHQAFLSALDEFAQTAPADDLILQAQIKTIRDQHDYLNKLAARASADSSSEQQLQGLARSLKAFEDSLNIYIQALLEQSKSQASDYRAQSEFFHAQVVWLEAIGLAALLLLLAIQFHCCLQPVANSLRRLQSGVDRIGRDFLTTAQVDRQAVIQTHKIQMDTGDELQVLAEAFNQMGDRLAESYRELERRVAERTEALRQANGDLQVEVCDRTAAENKLKRTLAQLKRTQLQLLHTEKMASLGQLVAGVAHEINNPVSFIQGNLVPAQEYVDSLIGLVRRYQADYPNASEDLQQAVEEADVDFIQTDFPKLLTSMQTGAERITTIVRSLRTFSHLDESETKLADIHSDLDSALLLLSSRLSQTADRPEITVVRDYGSLPQVYCYPSQLNQVFMGILTNAIDALTLEPIDCDQSTGWPALPLAPTLSIKTSATADYVRIDIGDNGPGMSEAVRAKLFSPFFTTKPVGSGMGLGLAMSYQIVVANHRGSITCASAPGKGSRFTIDIPLNLKLEGGKALAQPLPERIAPSKALAV